MSKNTTKQLYEVGETVDVPSRSCPEAVVLKTDRYFKEFNEETGKFERSSYAGYQESRLQELRTARKEGDNYIIEYEHNGEKVKRLYKHYSWAYSIKLTPKSFPMWFIQTKLYKKK